MISLIERCHLRAHFHQCRQRNGASAPINPRLAQSRSSLEDKQKKLMMPVLAFATALFIMINEPMVFVDYAAARSRYLFQLSVLKVAKPRFAPPHAHNPFPLAMIQWGDMGLPASRRLAMMRSLSHSFRSDDWLTSCFSQGTRHRASNECVVICLSVDGLMFMCHQSDQGNTSYRMLRLVRHCWWQHRKPLVILNQAMFVQKSSPQGEWTS